MMQWAAPYSVVVYLLAVLAVLVALYFARRTAISPALRAWWLFLPRVAVAAAVLAILLNPVRESTRQLPPRRPRASCLIDSSRSMALDRPVTRLQAVKQVVYEAQARLDGRDAAQLQLFHFGSRFSSVASLPNLRATDQATRLGEPLQNLRNLSAGSTEAVIVFSDGQVQDADALDQVIADYASSGIAVHVFPVGREGIRGDVAIERLSIPRGVKAGDQVPVGVTLRSQGYQGTRVPLQVHSDVAGETEPLVELPVTLAGGSQSFDLVVPADPRAGALRLSVPLQAEEAIASNNQVPFQLLARQRKIRVLYMEGTNYGGEYKFLEDALHDDPNIECVSMIVDDQYVNRPRLTRITDPYRGFPATRQELFEYDVVICSDISRGAFTRDQLDWTAELVRDRGGGFVMIGGHTSFGAGGWDQTIWDQLIPIDMRGGQIGRGVITQRFRVAVPASVQTHPIWRIAEDPLRNRQILDAMPAFNGTNLAQRVKPAATLLGQSAQRLTMAGISPVFACQAYGRGRTFAMLPDSTTAWGHDFERYWGEGDNRYFRQFWRNVVYWLTENSVSAQRRLVVKTDKLIYRPGESIELDAEAYDEQYQATTDYRLEARLLDAPGFSPSVARLEPDGPGYRGMLEAALPMPASDEETSTLTTAMIEVVATDADQEVARQEIPVQVLNDSDELLTPNPDADTLRHLADQTGGRVLRSAEGLVAALSGLETAPGRRAVYRSPAWDHPLVWLAMLGLVVGEWVLRRRWR
jgi:uncharacterized membrane protein